MEAQQASDNVGIEAEAEAAVVGPPDRLQQWARTEVHDRPGPFLLDLACLVVVAWLLWWLADNDGAYLTADKVAPATAIALLTPLLHAEWRAAPAPVRWLLVLAPFGGILSIAFAVDRAGFVAPALTLGIIPGIVLAASRLARRRWTTHAVVAIAAVGFVAWSWSAGLKWWVRSDAALTPRWDLLSWHNQSGMLSAGFAVWFSGLALGGRGWLAGLAGSLTTIGLVGAWLSSSRATVLFAAIGLAVALWLVAGRAAGRGRVVRRLVVTALATVAVTTALQAMLPQAAPSPLGGRVEEAAPNAIARTRHWEAAAGMFVERPWTGTGLGSYRAIMVRHNPPEGVLTSSAHSFWLEGLAEGGLLLGIPLLGLGAVTLFGVVRLLAARPGRDDEHDVDDLWLLGGVAATVAVLGHASIDFDFRYLTLVGLAAVPAGFLLARHAPTSDDRGRPGTWPAMLALTPPVLLVGVGLWGHLQETSTPQPLAAMAPEQRAVAHPPWSTTARLAIANGLADEGELEAAMLAASGPQRWNPGDPIVHMTVARLQYAQGRITGDELFSRLEPPPTALNQWARTAEALLEGGDAELAEQVARRTIEFHPEYLAWGIEGTVATAWRVLIDVRTRAEGCQEGARLLAEAAEQGFDPRGLRLEELRAWFLTQHCPG